MSDYIVSARKYRPDSFESLVGQENIARTLKNSIKRGQLAHAYLFCGPRGVGKTSTARIFAKTINCANPGPDMEPCGKCESCLSFAEGRSYCIHELDAASNNGVDDIKALIDQVRIPPQTGKYSVYIIDEVHMLSSAAFNAFLKTLEEPPAYAIFILATTEKHKILPTILSRCQTYDFNRITVEGIVGNLKSIAQKEGVAMRDALTIFDQTVAFCGKDVKYEEVIKNLNVLDYEYTFSLTDAFLAGDYRTAFLKFDEILSKGFNALHFVSALSSHFRDLLVSKTSGLEALLDLPESLKKRYAEQAGRCPLAFLYEAMNVTVQCESSYRASINPRFLIELTLMKLSALPAKISGQPAFGGTPANQEASPVQSRIPQATDRPQHAAQPQTSPAKPMESPEPSPAPAADSPTQAPAVPDSATDAPKPRRTRTARPSAIALNSIIGDAGDVSSSRPVAASGVHVPDEDILARWQDLAAMYAAKPRLNNTLATASLEIAQEGQTRWVTFKVLNTAQKEWIETKLLHELEGRFKQITGAADVRLRVDIEPEEERPQVNYMPSEKLSDLMSKNDEVRNLVSDFGLDLK